MQKMCTWNGRICKRCTLETKESAQHEHLIRNVIQKMHTLNKRICKDVH
jgi:hypothetical protein